MLQSRFRFFLFSLFSAILTFQHSLNTAASQTTLTRAQALEDAKATENLLKKYHPNLYAHRTPKQINRLWSEAKSQVPENPDFLDAATLAQKILAAACDAHTQVNLDKNWISDNWVNKDGKISGVFPKNLVIVGDDLYLDDSQFYRKDRVLQSINERKSGEIVNFIKSIRPADGCQNSKVLFTHHGVGRLTASILLTKFLGDGPKFEVKYKHTETGATTTVNLRQERLSALHQRSKYRSMRGRASALKSLGIAANERDWEFAYDLARQALVRSNENKSIFYIYLPSFDGAKAQSRYFDEQLRRLVKANPAHVIVDLTDNPGGWQGNAQQFMSYFLHTSSRFRIRARSRIMKNISDSNYIWHDKIHREWYSGHVRQYKRVRKRGRFYRLNERPQSFGNTSYKGKLTVLVSPKTGSAATTVATILKRKIGATIVGDIGDASMKTSCSGSPGAHLLPNSGTAILVPLVCGDRHPEAERKGDLFRPEIPVNIAKQNSRMTNAIILGEAIAALNLKEVARLLKPKQSAIISAELPSKKKQEFDFSRKTIPVTLSRHPYKHGSAWLGVVTADIAKQDVDIPEFGNKPSVVISKVFAGSPADKIGLQPGDIFLSIDSSEFRDTDEVMKSIPAKLPGQISVMKILRLANTTEDLISILHHRLNEFEDQKSSAFILGNIFIYGDFGHIKVLEGIRLLENSAKEGSTSAAAILGHFYSGRRRTGFFNGGKPVIERNFEKAMEYYTRAAALGDAKIMFQLAQMYDYDKRFNAKSKQNNNKRANANPELAAKYLLHSYRGRYRKARDELLETPYHWSKDARIALKKLLHSVGLFDGTFDGEIGLDSRKAIVRLKAESIALSKLPSKLPQ